MSELTVNISDFHCRGLKARNSQNAARGLDRPYGLFVKEAARKDAAGKNSLRLASAAPCTVFDIGEARQAQRARQRYTIRPIGISRKAQVVRFTAAAMQLAKRLPNLAPLAAVARDANGPMDLPPAA